MFKGEIGLGSKVDVTFKSDFTNSGSGLLLAGYGSFDGQSDVKRDTAAPGLESKVSLTVDRGAGMLRVFLDVADEDDSGVLEVKADGRDPDREAISGDTTWVYAID